MSSHWRVRKSIHSLSISVKVTSICSLLNRTLSRLTVLLSMIRSYSQPLHRQAVCMKIWARRRALEVATEVGPEMAMTMETLQNQDATMVESAWIPTGQRIFISLKRYVSTFQSNHPTISSKPKKCQAQEISGDTFHKDISSNLNFVSFKDLTEWFLHWCPSRYFVSIPLSDSSQSFVLSFPFVHTEPASEGVL